MIDFWVSHATISCTYAQVPNFRAAFNYTSHLTFLVCRVWVFWVFVQQWCSLRPRGYPPLGMGWSQERTPPNTPLHTTTAHTHRQQLLTSRTNVLVLYCVYRFMCMLYIPHQISWWRHWHWDTLEPSIWQGAISWSPFCSSPYCICLETTQNQQLSPSYPHSP